MGDVPRTTIRLCGRFEFEIDGQGIVARLPSGQARSLLTYLIANRDRAPERAELIDVIWPHSPPKDPASDIRPILSRVRRAVTPATLEGRDRIRLALPEPARVDTEQAADSLAAARAAAGAGEWSRARELSERARELLAGGFLPGVEAEWIETRRREVEELELEALELAARSGLEIGGADARGAERHARELVERSPYREAGYRMLMEALARDGNPAEALRVYERLRTVLREELGAHPAPELQALHRDLLAGEDEPAQATEPPPEPVPLPPLLSPRERGAFVGREAELETLRAAWRRARDGERELVLLAGAPGIGKTRLASEFAIQAHAEGTVLYAACPQDPVLPYQPIVEALRHYVLSHPDDGELKRLAPGAGELALLIPELSAADPADGGPPSGDPETRRYMMFDAIASLVATASERSPLMLVLDDLHWADPPTLQLLRHMLGSQRAASLLIVGTYREGEITPGHRLVDLIAERRRTGRLERIRLDGLDQGDVASLMTFYAGSDAPDALLRTVHEGTDGNPFFIEEVMRHLIESGALFEREGRWISALTADEIGVPEGVEEVLLSRLGRLAEPTRTALRSASVLGREFGFDVLRAMAAMAEDELIAALEEALAAQLVVEEVSRGEDSRYSFTHALVRETLYRGLSRARARQLHASAARAIEPSGRAEDDVRIAELALHYRLAGEAGDDAKAVEYSLRAGQRAFELFAWDDAAVHWDGAIRLLEVAGEEPETRMGLLVALADLMITVGDVGRQIGYLERALALSEHLDDAEHAAQVRSRLGMAYSWEDSIYADFVDLTEAFAYFDAAREVLDEGPARAARGHLEIGVATALTYGLRIPEGTAASRRGMDIATELGDDLLWIGAAETYAWHRIMDGDLSDGFETMERALELAMQRRRPLLAWLALDVSAQLTWGLGDPDEAQVLFERALALPRVDRTSYRQTLADGIGRCHLSRGELADARRLLPDAKPTWLTHSLKPLIDLWDGRWNDAEHLAGEVLSTSRRTGNRWDEWAADHLAARVLALRGEHEQAAERLGRALAIVVDGGAPYFELWIRPDLARSLAGAGRLEEARAQVERCREVIGRGEDWRGRAGHVDLADGVVLDLDGSADAVGSFARAVGTFERFHLRGDHAEAMFEWGRASARAGDRGAAAEKLDAALEILCAHQAGAPLRERVEGVRGRL